MKKNIQKNKLFTGTWVVMYFVLLLQILPQTSIIEALLFPLCFCVSVYHVTKYLSLKVLLKAIRSKRIVPFVVQFICCSLFVALMGFLWRYSFYYFEKLGYFPISVYFQLDYSLVDFMGALLSVGIIINLCFCSIGFYLAYSNLEKEHLEAQLQMLQAQITPHFMFNVLNHINVLMNKDVNIASDLLVKYSNILRYQLYSGKEEFVPLEQEIQFLKNFIDVERTRWKDKLEVKCEWNIDNKNIKIQPLLLITLIENAFKHVPRSTSENGFITILFEQKNNTVRLAVKNSKSRIKPTQKKNSSSGIGLENIKRRLSILYPDKHSLVINETDNVYSSTLEMKM